MAEPQYLVSVMRAAVFVTGTALVWSSPLPMADRLTDRDLKALVTRIEQGRDQFDNALEDKVKHSIVRGPNGEVNVDRYLDDFQESIDRLEGRLKPDYAASAEAGALLRQASAIERFFKQQPPGTRGESEWNRLASDLKTLAAAYGTEFPLPSDNAAVRRIGDRELTAALDQIVKGANQLKKAFDGDFKANAATDPATRQAAHDAVDEITKDAKALKSRVKDSNPSSAEADRLLADATKIQAFIESHQVPTATGAWSGVSEPLQTVASAYGASWPARR